MKKTTELASQREFFKGNGISWTGRELIIAQTTSVEDIARFIVKLERASDAMQFAIGDAVNHALATDGPLAEKRILGGLHGETRRGYAWVAEKFNPARRRIPRLSFRHHALVASSQFRREEADQWLDRAEEHGWSTREFKEALVKALTATEGTGGGAASQSVATFTELFRLRDNLQKQVFCERPIEEWEPREAKELAMNLRPFVDWHERARRRAESNG